MKNKLHAIVFWGAMWGIVEATLGFIMHAVNFTTNITGMIMFPIACYFMNKAYKASGNFQAVIFCSLLAASIKLTDLLIPTSIAIKVLHPSLCILLEGVVMAAALKILNKNRSALNLPSIFSFSLSWRIIYIAYLYLIACSFVKLPPFNQMFIKFIAVEGAINTAIISLYILLINRRTFIFKEDFNYSPIMSLSALIIAIGLKWVL